MKHMIAEDISCSGRCRRSRLAPQRIDQAAGLLAASAQQRLPARQAGEGDGAGAGPMAVPRVRLSRAGEGQRELVRCRRPDGVRRSRGQQDPAADAEQAEVGAGRADAPAPRRRNGVYRRRLVTELGAITDLAVPRRRLAPYRPSFLRRRRGGPGPSTTCSGRRSCGACPPGRRRPSRRRSPRCLPAGVGQPPRPGAGRPGRCLPPPPGRPARAVPPARRPLGVGPRLRPGAPAGRARGVRDRRVGQPRAARLPPGGVGASGREAPVALLARRARARPRRGRPRRRRRRGRDRGGGRRGAPGGLPPALLDPPAPQPARGPPARRAQALPAEPPGGLPGLHEAGRGPGVLALGDGVARTAPRARAQPRA